MSTKIICDRCRVKDGTHRHFETPFRVFNIDLCASCEKEVREHIKNYLIHRENMDNDFQQSIINPQPGAEESIMGKYGYTRKDSQ